MNRMVFVNLPVADVERSRAYFAGLGLAFDERFSDGKALCMVLGDHAFAMLLQRDFFAGFTPRPVADATVATEVLVGLSADDREDVDRLLAAALAAGGQEVREPVDHGSMYGRAFSDLDGHVWEVLWMDPAALADGTAG